MKFCICPCVAFDSRVDRRMINHGAILGHLQELGQRSRALFLKALLLVSLSCCLKDFPDLQRLKKKPYITLDSGDGRASSYALNPCCRSLLLSRLNARYHSKQGRVLDPARKTRYFSDFSDFSDFSFPFGGR